MHWQKKILSFLTVTSVSILFGITTTTISFAAGFNEDNNPEVMTTAGKFAKNPLKFNYHFDSLATSAKLKDQIRPWTDSYYPTVDGGIRNRYQTGKAPTRWDLMFQTKNKLKRMSANEIAQLSPTEKLDLYMGDYSFSFTKEEIDRTKGACGILRGINKGWWGLCHGWAQEALNRPEPNCITVSNPDGIQIKFGSSDLKALALYFAGEVSEAEVCQIGERCSVKGDSSSRRSYTSFNDVNPGAFLVTLANLIPNQQGFVMDRTADVQVWNQPIFGYSLKVLEDSQTASSGSASGTVREVSIKLKVDWVKELDSSMQPYGLDPEAQTSTTYTAVIELDSKGRIIGGRWTGNSLDEHPDFIWMKPRDNMSNYGDRWQAVDRLYKRATQ
ncbi:MAG: hypothetical protein HQK49_17690 [Oligoflexia bacterium]|nr:hypothetical protein [Oligoflexia bacterium]